ncbi:hypothetical protein GF402_01995 [Candidatus Fermentibacteria bacterium]|nr:hypothetical protein [Candidatus Fermentibacteria bacterium]
MSAKKLLEAFRERYGGKVASSAVNLFARRPSWKGDIRGRLVEIEVIDGDLLEVDTRCSSGGFFLSLTPRSVYRGLSALWARMFRGASFDPDPEFDRAFLIQTNDAERMCTGLGDAAVRTMIMQVENLKLLRVQSGVLTIRKVQRHVDESTLGEVWNLVDLACRLAIVVEKSLGAFVKRESPPEGG